MMITQENGKLVFGPRECTNCWGNGVENRQAPCPTCKGTGRGPRGGKNACRKCVMQGCGYIYIHDVPCTNCVAKGVPTASASQSDRYDYVSLEIWRSLTFKVYRSNRPQTGNEAILGHGCISSVTDYGRHKKLSDTELIEVVKNDKGVVQAATICDENNVLVDHVGIFCHNQGYSLRAVYASPETTTQTISQERTIKDYMATGMKIADAGGNGTMMAIYK